MSVVGKVEKNNTLVTLFMVHTIFALYKNMRCHTAIEKFPIGFPLLNEVELLTKEVSTQWPWGRG